MIFNTLVDPAFGGRFCLMLLHSLWQVALLALMVWCVERLWRSRSVERCYIVSVAALFAGVAAMPITYALIGCSERPRDAAALAQTLAAVGSRPGPIATSREDRTRVAPTGTGAVEPFLKVHARSSASAGDVSLPVAHSPNESWSLWRLLPPWIVTAYMVGVALMLARLIVAVLRAHHLGTHAELVTDGPLVQALRSLAGTWSMRVVPALARAEQIVVPTVVGLARPIILLPVSVISGLSMDDLEMILAHELAHVRRHDMWVNLLQRLAETVLFFNPALWYLSRRISTLREYCCDEMTCRRWSASVPEPRVRYATALLRLVELAKPATAGNHELASSTLIGPSPSEIRRRVARLFGEPWREPLRVSRAGVLTLISLGVALAIGPTVWKTRADSAVNHIDTRRESRLNVVGPSETPVPEAGVEIRTSPAPTTEHLHRGEFVRARVNADLTKIPRTIQKEPAYQSASAKYGLAVFGPEADTRVWLVHDGETLYVDRNGNGDLTEQDEKLPVADEHTFHIGAIRAGRRTHRAVTLKVYESHYNLDAQIEMPGLTGSGEGGRVWQFTDSFAFADKVKAAPIIHFDGPLEITLSDSGVNRLVAGRVNDLYLAVGTPGLGTGATAYVAYEGLIPESAFPKLEITFPPAQKGDPPIRELYELKDRC